MVYITGDCHGDWHKFSSVVFYEQKDLSKENDFVIVCGDFGLWSDTKQERWWLDWLEEKNFTILFVDGNHENFDRLYSNEFPIIDFYGGKAHQIRKNVFHLIRGNVFELCGKNFFAFGGANSHDISDGILQPKDYKDISKCLQHYRKLLSMGKMVRVNHVSWWEQEMPSQEEMNFGLETLKAHNNKVDFIITHCCPQHIASVYSNGTYKSDKLTQYFNNISENVEFTKWIFGHYHNNMDILDKYIMLYDQIIRIV